MSDEIDALKKRAAVAEQSLFFVLKQIGEPVVVDIDEAKGWLEYDNAVGMDIDKDTNTIIYTAGGIPNGAGS